jgi:hypothetical protein
MHPLESSSFPCYHLSLILFELALILLILQLNKGLFCLLSANQDLWLEEVLSCVPSLSRASTFII